MILFLALAGIALALNWKCERSRYQAATVVFLIAFTGYLSPTGVSWFLHMAAADLVAAFLLLLIGAAGNRTIAGLLLMDGFFQIITYLDVYLGLFFLWDAYSSIVHIAEYAALIACAMLSPFAIGSVVDWRWRRIGGNR